MMVIHLNDSISLGKFAKKGFMNKDSELNIQHSYPQRAWTSAAAHRIISVKMTKVGAQLTLGAGVILVQMFPTAGLIDSGHSFLWQTETASSK